MKIIIQLTKSEFNTYCLSVFSRNTYGVKCIGSYSGSQNATQEQLTDFIKKCLAGDKPFLDHDEVRGIKNVSRMMEYRRLVCLWELILE